MSRDFWFFLVIGVLVFLVVFLFFSYISCVEDRDWLAVSRGEVLGERNFCRDSCFSYWCSEFSDGREVCDYGLG